MPSKTNKGKAAQAQPTIPKEVIDQFVNGSIQFGPIEFRREVDKLRNLAKSV